MFNEPGTTYGTAARTTYDQLAERCARQSDGGFDPGCSVKGKDHADIKPQGVLPDGHGFFAAEAINEEIESHSRV